MFTCVNKAGEKIPIEIALDNKEDEYFCPVCNGKLLIKDGEINASHFAHVRREDCDTFSSDMSSWHADWQKQFPLENREVVLSSGKEKHRADVCIGGYVIEFQHSSISCEEFDARNDFYTSLGYKVIWIFDVIYEREEGLMKRNIEEWSNAYDNGSKWAWKYPWRFLRHHVPQSNRNIIIFFHLFNTTDLALEEEYYMEKVVWAIKEDYGVSNYKRFFTSYYPANATELKERIKEGQKI